MDCSSDLSNAGLDPSSKWCSKCGHGCIPFVH
jgi:hypothetical protein